MNEIVTYHFKVQFGIYTDFIKYLDEHNIKNRKLGGFKSTPTGYWCIVKATGNYNDLEDADKELINLMKKL